MSTPKDGGPAFPHTIRGLDGFIDLDAGMTLRDYFAAQALSFAMSAAPSYGLPSGFTPNDPLAQTVRYAYQIADAMLKAREAGE